MASTLSPEDQGASASGSHGRSDQDKGPLTSLNLGFLKSLSDKKTTRDGNPPRRRGPKPDSKPALTRRQELNRQAQRTHRERKELYVKALEDEVLRLKEVFSNISQDKEKVIEENHHLRQLLAQHGISLSSAGSQEDVSGTPSGAYTTSASPSGYSNAQQSHTALTPPLTSKSSVPSASPSYAPFYARQTQYQPQHMSSAGVDLEQAGIDFVLALEKPCMKHLPWLLERTTDADNEPCGHALMASCPPEPFPELTPDIPFGYSNVNGELNSGQRTWELSKADLSTLLDLSKRLNLDGEVTPVMAWGLIMAHPRFYEARAEDFNRLAEELLRKIRCYGFGAVMEEFEVRDTIESVFGSVMQA